jgi:hypothetical protein
MKIEVDVGDGHELVGVAFTVDKAAKKVVLLEYCRAPKALLGWVLVLLATDCKIDINTMLGLIVLYCL